MKKGSYIVDASKDERQIKFIIHPDFAKNAETGKTGSIPEDEQELVIEIERTLTVLNMVFADNEAMFKKYFKDLLKLSQVGLVPPIAQTKFAKKALNSLQQEIIEKEGGRIKNNYLRLLGLKVIFFALPALTVGIILHFILPSSATIVSIRAVLFIFTGSMVGVWLSFAIQKVSLDFYSLHILEKDRLEPSIRLIYTGLLSMVFGILFIKDGIVIQFGSVRSKDIITDILTAMLFGVLLGISEKTLGLSISQKLSKIIKKE